MPVVLVTAPPLASADAEHAALSAINTAVARGLQLRAEDVYSTFSPAAVAALGAQAVRPWPVVLVHGAARPRELMSEAIRLTRQEICSRWQCPDDTVWVQWVVPA